MTNPRQTEIKSWKNTNAESVLLFYGLLFLFHIQVFEGPLKMKSEVEIRGYKGVTDTKGAGLNKMQMSLKHNVKDLETLDVIATSGNIWLML